MAPAKLTKAILEQLKPGERVRDTKVRGLFAERGVRGVSLKIQADLLQPGQPVRTIRATLGRFPDIDLESARAEAQRRLSDIKRGIDIREPVDADGKVTVAAMFEAYRERMVSDGCAERSVTEHAYMLSKYLPLMASRAVADIKPSELKTEHKRITEAHGPVVANKAMRAFRSAFNLLARQADDPDQYRDNPTRAVNFHAERRKEAVILPHDLRDWYARLQKTPNPLRRLMHELGLFSGLRPGNLVSLEKAWIQLENGAIVVPRTKMGRQFALPLSGHMVGLVKRSLELSETFHAGSPWLFPTRTADGKGVIATQVVRERSMPGETGHILRHTHATLAKAAGVDDMLASLLSDHKVAGIRGVYVHERALFEQLLGAQEKVTAHILKLL